MKSFIEDLMIIIVSFTYILTIAACLTAPLLLALYFSPWWLIEYIFTIPTAFLLYNLVYGKHN